MVLENSYHVSVARNGVIAKAKWNFACASTAVFKGAVAAFVAGACFGGA